MRASQWEFSQVVVEGGGFPGAGAMAGTAIGPELTAVVVILGMTGAARCGGALKYAVDVTGRTSRGNMGAGQFESGVVVIEGGRLPGAGRMALSTDCPKLAGMRILVGVAGEAGLGSTFKHTVDVTGSAIYCNMCAGEFKDRVVVIEGGRFPGARGMALFAIRPELATMRILVGVACKAGLGSTFKHTVDVTGSAIYCNMCAGEFKDGVVVIEGGRFPSAGRMALFASGPELSTMRILGGVACKAGLRGALEHVILVAGRTSH